MLQNSILARRNKNISFAIKAERRIISENHVRLCSTKRDATGLNSDTKQNMASQNYQYVLFITPFLEIGYRAPQAATQLETSR